MKIEKLRNNHKKEIIIGTILTVVIGGALTFKLTHSKYRVTQSIDLASGVINYKVPDFKIMAMYKNDGSGDVSIDSMPTSGYVINEEKTYCQTSSGSEVKGKIKTISGNHVISGLNKRDKCYLYFNKVTAADIILVNAIPKTTTPNFNTIAKTDEGVYATTDGMYGGTTYYWRGAATTNHVIFANKCWRIVRINGDKTIRLIYNGYIIEGDKCTGNGANADSVIFPNNDNTNSSINLNKYATTGNSYMNPSYVGWSYTLSSQRPSNITSATASNAKVQTESWYSSNITGTNATKVADGKYCNDRSIESGSWSANESSSFYYAGYTRLVDNKIPTFNCPSGDVYTLKAGAITADEVMFAGGTRAINSSYYLYNGKDYWTMSPYYWSCTFVGAYMFKVAGNGFLGDSVVNGDISGLRPVINLKSDVTFSSGDGTQNTPYVVS